MLVRRAEPGSNQQRADLVAIQANRMRLIVQPWPTPGRGRDNGGYARARANRALVTECHPAIGPIPRKSPSMDSM